jgi:PhnB protein
MSATNIQPYLFFNGRCEEALEFYRRAVNAEIIMLLRYKDSPSPETTPRGFENKVMHANFRIGDTQIMASDGRGDENLNFQGFALILNVAAETEARLLFAGLADGGQVQMPLGKTFYSPCFGMVTDRFGILWMVLTASQHSSQ